ncbi:uncharacterized protein BKA78DRAFT_313329 [Phyllosticta capitalensis]|uniref:uncharacterized protein n=1 Tax=Phyllosticta capitalensis TaxID=121624 RepID=UPI0031316C13
MLPPETRRQTVLSTGQPEPPYSRLQTRKRPRRVTRENPNARDQMGWWCPRSSRREGAPSDGGATSTTLCAAEACHAP